MNWSNVAGVSTSSGGGFGRSHQSKIASPASDTVSSASSQARRVTTAKGPREQPPQPLAVATSDQFGSAELVSRAKLQKSVFSVA